MQTLQIAPAPATRTSHDAAAIEVEQINEAFAIYLHVVCIEIRMKYPLCMEARDRCADRTP